MVEVRVVKGRTLRSGEGELIAVLRVREGRGMYGRGEWVWANGKEKEDDSMGSSASDSEVSPTFMGIT